MTRTLHVAAYTAPPTDSLFAALGHDDLRVRCPFDERWPEGAGCLFYRLGVSARGVEGTWDQDRFTIRQIPFSSAADWALGLRLAQVVSAHMNAPILDEDEEELTLDAAEWEAARVEANATSLRKTIAQLDRGEGVGLRGPRRPVFVGPRMRTELALDEAGAAERLTARVREVQFDPRHETHWTAPWLEREDGSTFLVLAPDVHLFLSLSDDVALSPTRVVPRRRFMSLMRASLDWVDEEQAFLRPVPAARWPGLLEAAAESAGGESAEGDWAGPAFAALPPLGDPPDEARQADERLRLLRSTWAWDRSAGTAARLADALEAVAERVDDPEELLALYAEAREARSVGADDPGALGVLWIKTADVYAELRVDDEAHRALEQAWGYMVRALETDDVLWPLSYLVRKRVGLYLDAGDHAAANATADRLLALGERLGREGQALAGMLCARVRVERDARGAEDVARASLERLARLEAAELDAPLYAAQTLCGFLRQFVWQERVDAGVELALRAFDLAPGWVERGWVEPGLAADLFDEIRWILSAAGLYVRALEVNAESMAWLARGVAAEPDRFGPVRIWRALYAGRRGAELTDLRRVDEARRAFEEALAAESEIEPGLAPNDRVDLLTHYAEACVADLDPHAALALCDQIESLLRAHGRWVEASALSGETPPGVLGDCSTMTQQRGAAHALLGDMQGARTCYDYLRAAAEVVGGHSAFAGEGARAVAEQSWGVLVARSAPDEARALLERSATILLRHLAMGVRFSELGLLEGQIALSYLRGRDGDAEGARRARETSERLLGVLAEKGVRVQRQRGLLRRAQAWSAQDAGDDAAVDACYAESAGCLEAAAELPARIELVAEWLAALPTSSRARAALTSLADRVPSDPRALTATRWTALRARALASGLPLP